MPYAGAEENEGDGIPVLDQTVAFKIDDTERKVANIVIFKGCVGSDGIEIHGFLLFIPG